MLIKMLRFGFTLCEFYWGKHLIWHWIFTVWNFSFPLTTRNTWPWWIPAASTFTSCSDPVWSLEVLLPVLWLKTSFGHWIRNIQRNFCQIFPRNGFMWRASRLLPAPVYSFPMTCFLTRFPVWFQPLPGCGGATSFRAERSLGWRKDSDTRRLFTERKTFKSSALFSQLFSDE